MVSTSDEHNPSMWLNQTPEHARLRVLEARTGSLTDATDEYLSALRSEVQTWLHTIDRELATRIAREGQS